MMVKNTMLDCLVGTVAPHPCSSCGATGAILCESCKYNIMCEGWSACALCEKPCGKRGLCAQCYKKSPFEQFWVVGRRHDDLGKLIDEYKFGSKREAVKPLVCLLDEVLPVLDNDVFVVGVPTHSHGVRVRGFDHIGLIVRNLADSRGLDLSAPLERSLRAELHLLGLEDRLRLKDSLFVLSGAKVPKRVLLVDDVVTTGTTMLAAAGLLKAAGAEQIYGAAIARQTLSL